MQADRPLPTNIQAEESIIGACLQDSNCFAECINSGMKQEYFFKPELKTIWGVIAKLNTENNGQYDYISICDAIRHTTIKDDTIRELQAKTPTSALLSAWIKIVGREFARREMILKCGKYYNAIYADDFEFSKECEKFISETRDLVQISQNSVIENNLEIINKAFKRVNEQGFNLEKYMVPYCIDGTDEQINHPRKTMHVLAAMPGTGKTGFALSILNAQIDRKIKHVIFCNESSTEDLMIRLFAISSDIESHFMTHSQDMPEAKRQRVFWPSVQRIQDNANMFRIFGKGKYLHSPSGISSKLAGLRDNGFRADMVTIDYLQTMISPANPKASSPEKIEANVFELSRIFSEFNVAGLVLSQFNRDKGRDTGSRQSVMADLRGSSSIEAEADIVSFLQRENKGIEGRVPVKWYSDKVRGSKVIDCQLEFNSSNGRFLKVISKLDNARSYK